ncbi:MAG: hypothetical protein FWC03_04225 [Treponema sp.]|nr:hypothetical protein [Treponema sp.]
MRKNSFKNYLFIIAVICILGSCNDPVYFAISQEVEPIDPKIGGAPTNFIIYDNAMYVASRSRLWKYSGDKTWEIETGYEPGWHFLQLAKTDNYLYALIYEEQESSTTLKLKRFKSISGWEEVGGIIGDYSIMQYIFAVKNMLFIGAANLSNSNLYQIHYVDDSEGLEPQTAIKTLNIANIGKITDFTSIGNFADIGNTENEAIENTGNPESTGNTGNNDNFLDINDDLKYGNAINSSNTGSSGNGNSGDNSDLENKMDFGSEVDFDNGVDLEICGVTFDGTNYYLCTRNKGIYTMTDPSAGINFIYRSDRELVGIINLDTTLNTNKIVAISREGELYSVIDAFAKIESINIRDRMATGALTIWTDPNNSSNMLLLAGRQDRLEYSTSSGYTYGYVELELDLSQPDGIKMINNPNFNSSEAEDETNIRYIKAQFMEPGLSSVTSITSGNNDRFKSTIGKHPVNHIIQAQDGILFASTQKNGVWSYRLDRSGGPQWNAE